MKTIYEKEIFTMSQSEENDFLQVKWKQKPDSSTYREVFTEVLRLVREHKITKYLSDLTHSGSASPEDRKWLEVEILPLAIDAGLKNIASVIDQDVFKKYYVSRVATEATQGGAHFKTFDTYQHALDWLEIKEN